MRVDENVNASKREQERITELERTRENKRKEIE
jgi:hypothetical protein